MLTNYVQFIQAKVSRLARRLNYRQAGLILFTGLLLLTLFISAAGEARGSALSDAIEDKLDDVQIAAQLPASTDPVAIVSTVVKAALGVVAIIFFVLVIAAGFRWMTAGGSEEPIKKAKDQIKHALIGLVIVIFSYAITSLVFDLILK